MQQLLSSADVVTTVAAVSGMKVQWGKEAPFQVMLFLRLAYRPHLFTPARNFSFAGVFSVSFLGL